MAPQVSGDNTEALRELLDVSIEEPRVDGAAVKEHERLPLTLFVIPHAAAGQFDHARHADSVVEEWNPDQLSGRLAAQQTLDQAPSAMRPISAPGGLRCERGRPYRLSYV